MTFRFLFCAIAMVFMLMAWGYAFYVAHKVSLVPRKSHSSTARPLLQISDLLSCFAAVLPPLALISVLRRSQNLGSLPMVLCCAALVFVFAVMWWQGTRFLNAVAVHNGLKRFVYLALLLPGLLVGGWLFLGFLFALFNVAEADFPWQYLALATLAFALVGWIIATGQRWVFQLPRNPSTNRPRSSNSS